ATYVCDGQGRVWTISDVMPGDAARARAAYDAGVRMGDTSIAHRRLCREGLFVQGATGSRDMRLGAGASVKAVRSGQTAWSDGGPRALWEVPLEAQIERAYAALALPGAARSAGAMLLFV